MPHDVTPHPRQDLTPDDARAALAGAAASAARLRARARWASTKLLVFGVGMGLVTLSVGMLESKLLGAAVFAAWGALAFGMSRWERRRTVHLPGTGARTAPYWSASIALYAVAIAAGTEQSSDPTYWVPAALVVPLPLLTGAVRERRA
jgi:hypothetical protein